MRGVTIACLKGSGKMSLWRDKLTSFVNEGRRISIHFFMRYVGHGSREQVLEGKNLREMSLVSQSLVTAMVT